MRKSLQLVAYLHLLVLLTIFAISSALLAQNSSAELDLPEYWVALRQVDWAQYGQSQAAIAIVEGNLAAGAEGHSAKLSVFSRPPAREAIVIRTPRVGADGYSEFAAELSALLKPAGIIPREEDAAQVFATGKPRIIVAPSGAWPKSLDKNGALCENDTVIFFGAMPQFELDDDGNASAKQEKEWTGGERISIGSESAYAGIGDWGGNAYYVPKMLDQEQSPKIAAAMAARLAMLEDKRALIGIAASPWGENGVELVANVSEKTKNAFARILIFSPGGEAIKAWDREIEIPSGEISGPANVYGGKMRIFKSLSGASLQKGRMRNISQCFLLKTRLLEPGRRLAMGPLQTTRLGSARLE